MIAGTLEIQLLANMARLQKDMDDAKRAVGGAMSSIEKSVEAAKNALGSLAAGVSVGMFVGMIRGAIDVADNLNDLSKTTGIAIDQLAGLKLAAKQSGGDLEGIAGSINKLSVAMGKDGERFAKLGVSAKDPLEAFKQLADVFAAIKDPQMRAAFGAEALGKSWASAAPLLAEGGKKIGEMVEKGKALSGVTQEMANQADAFNDMMAELETATGGAKMKLAGELLPAMIDVTKAITTAYEESGKLQAIWVALGAMGAFAYTNEFSSATVKIKDLFGELGKLEKEQSRRNQAQARGMVDWVLFGDSSAELAKKISDAKSQIQGLRDQMDQPAKDAASKAAEKKELARLAKETAEAEAKATEFLKLNEAEGKKAAAARAAQVKSYQDLIAGIKEKIDVNAQELALGRKLTDAEKQMLDIQKLVVKGTISAGDASSEKTKKMLTEFAQSEKLRESMAARELAAKSLREEERKSVEEQEKIVLGLGEQNKALKEEIEIMGLSAKGQLELLQARNNAIIATKQQELASIAAADAETGTMSRRQIALAEEIRLLQERNVLMGDKSVLQESMNSFREVWESVDRTAHDVFVNIFEGGQDAFTKLRNVLKATLLDLLYQMTVKKWIFNISASVTGTAPGIASAATGQGSGMLSNASSLNTLYGAGSQALFGATAGASTASLFAANAAGMVGGDALGTLIAANGAWAGVAAGAASATAATAAMAANVAMVAGEGVALAAGTTAAAAGGGAAASGALLGMGPAGWAALAVVAAFAIFGGKKGPSGMSTGDATVSYDPAGKETSRLDLSAITYYKAQATAASEAFVSGMQSSYAKASAALGIEAAYSTYSFGGNQRTDGTDKNFRVTGAAGKGYYDSGIVAYSEEAMQRELSRVMFSALQGSELPKYLQGAFDGMSAASMNAEQISGVLAAAQALKGFHDQLQVLPFESLKDLTFGAYSGLIAFSGGMDKLSANLGSYLDNFYSEEEKRALAIKNINAATAGSGLDAATATRESFRALVESQDLTTEAGQKTYAALLGVSGAFAGITPVIESVAAAVGDVVASISDAMKSMQVDAANLQIEIMRKTGNTGGADYAQRALDTTSFSAAEVALYDYNNSLRAQIAALDAATASAEAAAQAQAGIASERAGLQQQYDQLTMNSAELLAQQRDGLDESNRALFDSINALKAKTAAEQAAAQATQQAAQAMASFMEAAQAGAQQMATAQAAEKTSLQSQLDGLTLNGADATAKQRQALFGVNRVLFDQVQAATSVADAQKDLIAVSQDAANSFGSLGDSLRSFRDGVLADAAGVNGSQAATALAAGSFRSVSTRASLGDKEAMGQLAGAGQGYLTAAAASASTALDYQRALLTVLGGTDTAISVADRQVSLAEQQLDALTGIKEVLTMAQAQAALADAQGSLASVNANAPYAAAMAKALDAYNAGRNTLLLQSIGQWQQGYDDPAYAKTAAAEIAAKEAALKAAYEATVAGIKAGRSQVVSAPVPTPSRSPSAAQSGSPDVVAAINLMRAEQLVANREIALNTLRLVRLQDKWDNEGQPDVREPVVKVA